MLGFSLEMLSIYAQADHLRQMRLEHATAAKAAVKRGKPVTPGPAVSDGEAAPYERIRDLVVAARQTVARGVDLVQVHTNFRIGRHIVEQEQRGEQRAAYGKAVLKALAEKLTQEFRRGFSKSYLEYMRRFYLFYQERASIAQSGTGQFPATALPAA